MGPHYYFDGFGLVWALLNFLFWAALIGLAIWAVLRLSRSGPLPRYPVGPPPQAHHRESPREILDRRFASGEIDAPAYEDMRARIEGARPHQAHAAQAGPAAQAPRYAAQDAPPSASAAAAPAEAASQAAPTGPAPQAALGEASQGELGQGSAEPPAGEGPTKQL